MNPADTTPPVRSEIRPVPARPGRAGRPTGRPPSPTGAARPTAARPAPRPGAGRHGPARTRTAPCAGRAGTAWTAAAPGRPPADRPGHAQVSGIRQGGAALAVPLREVADDLLRLAPAHRRARRPGLRPRLPLLPRPLPGAPLPAGRRLAAGQVIAAGGIEEFRELLDPDLRAASSYPRSSATSAVSARQRRGLLILGHKPRRLLADQRITRILRRQRLGHATRSSRNQPGRRHDTPPTAQP
jgi:hypothetical protein